MANGTKQQQGVGSFGFPSFRGPVIPQLQLRPAAINFPRPSSGGGGRSKSINPAAYFAPGLVSLLGDKFLPKPDVIERQPTGDDAVDRAMEQADIIYGPEREDPTLWQELLPMGVDALVAAGFGDEGGAQYAQTAVNKRIANLKNTRDIASDKRQFIKEQLKDKKVPFENYIDTDALTENRGRIELTGHNHPTLGLLLRDPDNPNAIKEGPYQGYTPQRFMKGNFVKSGTFDENRVKGFVNEDVQDMMKKTAEFNALDIGTFDSLLTINSLVDTLQNSEGEPLALTGGALSVLADDINVNLSNLANSMGYGRNTQTLFSTDQKGGTVFKGSGELIAELKLLTDERRELVENNQNTQEIDADILRKYENYHQRMMDTGDQRLAFKMFDENLLEQNAFDRVTAMSDYITLGYQIAGTRFGQTGRTLSDKDLAFALQSIGFGATQNKDIAVAQLMKVGDALINQTDLKIRYTHSPEDYLNLPWNENKINAYRQYWEPDVKKEDGSFDWESPSKKWNYIDLEERANRRLGEGVINPVVKFREFKSDLYKDRRGFINKQIRINIPNLTQSQEDLLIRINNKP